ncbi:MAG: hypothetical protein ACK4GQ_04310 [Candidatus Hadarchaeales archaeon]
MEEPSKAVEKKRGVYLIGALLIIVFIISLAYYFKAPKENTGTPGEQPPENKPPSGETSPPGENAAGQPDFRILVTGNKQLPVKKPASEEEERAQVATRVRVENISPSIPPVSLSWIPQPPGLDIEILPSQEYPPFEADVYVRVYYDFPTTGPYEITIRGVAVGTEVTRENTITLLVS